MSIARGEFLDLEGEIDFNQAMESVLETSYKITIIDLVKLGDPMNRFETARRFAPAVMSMEAIGKSCQ